MKRVLKYLGIGFLLLIGSMIIKTAITGSVQPDIPFKYKSKRNDAAVSRLSKMLQFQTVSYDDSPDHAAKIEALNQLYDYLNLSYPGVFQTANVIKIGHSRLITLVGADKNLKPALFLAHLDVVPADSHSNGHWQYPPFMGMVKADTIYGRGVLDDKCIAAALLEAMEMLIQNGKRPKRTIMIALGHDEETGGREGAFNIAAYLEKSGIKAEFICDEGFGIMEGLIPGVAKPVAMIGITEKGFLSVKLSVSIAGGHSSMPKNDNATSLLAKALTRVEKAKYLEAFCDPQKQFFRTIAPEASLGYRLLFSNLWVTAPLVKMVLKGNEKTAATIRTTHATTIIKAGEKANVLPAEAQAMINFRILPGQTIADLVSDLKNAIDDQRVTLTLLPDRNDPAPISPTSGVAWSLITETIHECFENTLSAPAMVITGTDCKNYTSVSQNIYRFTPLRLNNNNIGGIHGANEKLATQNYFEVINYYKTLFGKL